MSSRIWFGLIFILLGIGFFMHQTDVLDISVVISNWWPLILIIIGIVQLFNRSNGSTISGFLFLLIGGLFLVNQWVDVNLYTYIWPLLFIFIGLVFLFSRTSREKSVDVKQDINSFVLFGGEEIRNQSGEFKGGTVTAIFGGTEIDLRDAMVVEDGAKIDITAIFGGVSIIVPENVQVEAKGVPIFGGWEDKTRRRVNNEEVLPVLHLNCLAVFGGVEVKD